MKKVLIVGLGNVGKEYQETRHNIGFSVLDYFLKKQNGSLATFESAPFASRATCHYKGRIFILIKPTTFMNLSGKAVRYWLDKERLSLSDVLIITDDLHLPTGKVRLRAKGRHGGHNGLRSIEEELETEQYPRLRFGVGKDFQKGQQVDYVLGHWTEEEQAALPPRLDICCQAIFEFALAGPERAMSLVNGL